VRGVALRLPAEPILAYPVRPLALQMAARHGGKPGTHARLLARARVEGSITIAAADKVATALGTHPHCLWGKAWEQVRSFEDSPGKTAEEAALPTGDRFEEPASEAPPARTCRFPNCDALAETEDLLARHALEAHPRWCRTCHRSFAGETERATHQTRAHGASGDLPETPAPKAPDVELEAIRTCCSSLLPLSPLGRWRVLDYLAQRFVVDAGTEDPRREEVP
jgi:hypothetical protein